MGRKSEKKRGRNGKRKRESGRDSPLVRVKERRYRKRAR